MSRLTTTARLADVRQRIGRLGARYPALVAVIAAGGLLGFPFMASDYWIDVAVFWGIYVLLSLSLNVILGEVGLLDMGHMAFFAIGAYTTAILSTRFGTSLWVLLPVSACAAGLAGHVLARPIIHLRGDYLLIATIGMNEIVRITLLNNPWGLTGGPNGIIMLDQFRVFGLVVQRPIHFYYLVWTFVMLTVFALVRLQRSRIGRAWNCIREDQVAAEAMGIDTRWAKLLAFTLGAGIAGAAGTVFAAKLVVISPESFTFTESVMLFAIVILGGMGSVPGVVLASGAMLVLPEALRDFAQYRMLFFGAAMALMMIFRPQGLWPSKRWQTTLREGGERG